MSNIVVTVLEPTRATAELGVDQQGSAATLGLLSFVMDEHITSASRTDSSYMTRAIPTSDGDYITRITLTPQGGATIDFGAHSANYSFIETTTMLVSSMAHIAANVLS